MPSGRVKVWLFMTEKMLKKQFTYRFLCANITYINNKKKKKEKEERERDRERS